MRAGIPKELTNKVCARCARPFLGFNGNKYCDRKCMLRANTREENGCWIWTGYVMPVKKNHHGGYGEAYFGAKPNREKVLAHRASYEAFVGPTDGLCVLHKCGTRADNNADRDAKGRHASQRGSR